MCLRVSYKKKNMKFCFSYLKSLKNGVGPELYLDLDPLVRGANPDPHQNVTDPQHCFKQCLLCKFFL
jgi:hypothetical protein